MLRKLKSGKWRLYSRKVSPKTGKPGHSRDEARALIQKTHVNPDAPPHAKKHVGRVAFARSALARLRSNSFEPP
jgi:hypothetical protein